MIGKMAARQAACPQVRELGQRVMVLQHHVQKADQLTASLL